MTALRITVAAAAAVLTACTAVPPRSASEPGGKNGFVPAHGPFAAVAPHAIPQPSTPWLGTQSDVIVLGQSPVVYLYAEGGGGQFRSTRQFQLLDSRGSPVPASCDPERRPQASRGYAALDFTCQYPTREGLYTIVAQPKELGLAGSTASMPLRVLAAAPRVEPAPAGWPAVSLATRRPPDCYGWHDYYAVRLDAGKLRIGKAATLRAPIPSALLPRMSRDHAAVVKYVFEDPDGWLALFDHGEFGGGVEWYAREGGEPRSIVIGANKGDLVPQNVNRAMSVGGTVFVLQGLSHMGYSGGQLSTLSHEHDHFTSRVIARYLTEPVDWLLEPDGTWLVLTWDGIWRTSQSGELTLFARLPDVCQPTSMTRTADNHVYIGCRGGAVRLVPRWNQDPRFAPEWLIPEDSKQAACWEKAIGGLQVEPDAAPLSPKDVDRIKRMMIQTSIDNYAGPCPCPYNTTRNGRRCGKRSAYDRPGGESPLCRPGDISDEMVREFMAAQER